MKWWKSFVRWRTHAAYWEQSAATNLLNNAWSYVYRTRWNCASARERACLLPEDREALDILHQLSKESLDRQCQL